MQTPPTSPAQFDTDKPPQARTSRAPAWASSMQPRRCGAGSHTLLMFEDGHGRPPSVTQHRIPSPLVVPGM